MNRNHGVLAILFLGLMAQPALSAPQPADPDLDQSLISSINALAANLLAEPGGVGFSVAISRRGEILHARGYGRAEVEHNVDAKGDTVFRIGSITKQFTAAAIMRLIEQGKLSLDDELSQFFPEFPTQGHTVTIRHLLTHTSGIKSYTGVDAFWQTSVARELTVEELLDFVKDETFEFEPGKKFAYNNTAYYMLGPIIEQASGMSYCDYIQTEFFEPLGLTRTRCDFNADIIPNRAQGYGLADERLVNDGLIGMDNPGAAGMLISTARDLVRWNMALMNGKVVSPDSLEQMMTPFLLPNGENTGYGFGLGMDDFEGHRRISHGGGIYGFNSMLACYPDDDVYVAVISNSTAASAGNLAREIAIRMLGIEIKVAELTQTTEELDRLSGLYVMEQLGLEIRVRVKADGLYMQAKDQPEFKLLYQGNGEYLASFDTVIKIIFDISTTDGPSPSFIFHQGAQKVWAYRQEDDVDD